MCTHIILHSKAKTFRNKKWNNSDRRVTLKDDTKADTDSIYPPKENS